MTNDGVSSSAESTLLWEKHEPPTNPTRYNLSSFAITLNELTPNLKVHLIGRFSSLLLLASSDTQALFLPYLFRRNCRQQIQGLDRISDIWRTGSTIKPILRSYGWRQGNEWCVFLHVLLHVHGYYFAFTVLLSFSEIDKPYFHKTYLTTLQSRLLHMTRLASNIPTHEVSNRICFHLSSHAGTENAGQWMETEMVRQGH